MYKKLLLALGLMVLGASLMVAAAVAGTTSTSSASKKGVTKGGTLRLNVSNTDYEYLDPALSYDSIGWSTIYAVNMQLLNYPDKPASAGGNQLVPEAATGFPTVSKDGKTYTFTVKSGLKFSDGSAVTGAAFQRAVFRVCHPDQGSPAVAFAGNFGNCAAFNEKKASSLTGITAKGQTDHLQAEPGRSDVPLAALDAVLRGREAEHGDRSQGDQRLSLGGPVQDRLA